MQENPLPGTPSAATSATQHASPPAADPDRLAAHVAALAGIHPARNYRNAESLNRAAAYIRRELESYGYPVSEQTWTARHAGHQADYANLIAAYNPGGTRRLVLGAHYDVDGDQPGADDNASAVAGLLESARLIAAAAPDLDYRIDFVAYCLEELPFAGTEAMGSRVHARSLRQDGADLIGMVCFEMIGYFDDRPGSQSYPPGIPPGLYPDAGDFILVVGVQQHGAFSHAVHRAMAARSGIPSGSGALSSRASASSLDVQHLVFPSAAGDAIRSDHASYWLEGYPAVMITDTAHFRNPNYHQPTDTPDTLHYPTMARVVDAACAALTSF